MSEKTLTLYVKWMAGGDSRYTVGADFAIPTIEEMVDQRAIRHEGPYGSTVYIALNYVASMMLIDEGQVQAAEQLAQVEQTEEKLNPPVLGEE